MIYILNSLNSLISAIVKDYESGENMKIEIGGTGEQAEPPTEGPHFKLFLLKTNLNGPFCGTMRRGAAMSNGQWPDK